MKITSFKIPYRDNADVLIANLATVNNQNISNSYSSITSCGFSKVSLSSGGITYIYSGELNSDSPLFSAVRLDTNGNVYTNYLSVKPTNGTQITCEIEHYKKI